MDLEKEINNGNVMKEQEFPFINDIPKHINPIKDTLKIVIWYTLFGALWVLISNKVISFLFSGSAVYTKILNFKGWLFVIFTSLVIFMLIYRRMLLLQHANKHVVDSYGELTLSYEEMIATEEELRKQRDLTDSIIEKTPALIVISDMAKKVIRINTFALEKLGYTADELNNQDSKKYVISTNKVEGNIYEGKLITKAGKKIDVLWNVSIINDQTSQLHDKVISVGTDITDHKNFEEQLNTLAYYDSLTGLPNKAMLEIELEKLIKQSNETVFSIIYMDVDNFKYINDSMGHDAGDIFLQYVAISLQKAIKPPHIVSHLGGDEFAVVVIGIVEEEVIREIIKKITDNIGNMWNANSFDFYITMSIGVAQYPKDGLHTAELIKNSDIAMYKAKHEGKGRHVFFSDKIQKDNLNRINLINQLQRAIDNKEFILMYQPQFNLLEKRIIGVEALIRWDNPIRGIVPPLDFIPLAEETGQIFDIERWVFSEALRQKLEWRDMGYEDIAISINLSSKTLVNETHFVKLEELLYKHDFGQSELVVEITETAFMEDTKYAIDGLLRMKQHGIKIALDDFGTGYSSLTYLKELPIDLLKLDRGFISNVGEYGKECIIVKLILQLAKELKYQVVAEGIETDRQLNYLLEFGCQSGQGYLFDKPIPAKEIEEKYFKSML